MTYYIRPFSSLQTIVTHLRYCMLDRPCAETIYAFFCILLILSREIFNIFAFGEVVAIHLTLYNFVVNRNLTIT